MTVGGTRGLMESWNPGYRGIVAGRVKSFVQH